MEAVTLLIAVVALALAIVAFLRTGGVHDVRHSADAARDRTADILDRLEQIVRGKEKPPQK